MDSKNLKYLIPSIIFLILSAFGIFYIINSSKSTPSTIDDLSSTISITPTITPIPEITSIPTISITATPTATPSNTKSNILKISDLQMTFPESWKVASISGNSAKILTDYKQYQVYLTLKLDKNNSNAESGYKSKSDSVKTEYGEIFNITCGGSKGCTGALINKNKYEFVWNIESNQSVPKDLDQVWTPDNNVTSEILLNITKTVRTINSTTIAPTATPTAKLTPTPSEIRDLKSEISITPTPISSNYSSSTDGFSIVYSSFRKLYQDKETSGNRYTFYSNSGNFAVHVGLNNQWAWTTPDRNFSGNLVLSGQNTYRYDTDSQTIVDIQYNNKNYTLQCVHNGKSTLKAECETFLQSFKLI